MLRKKAGQSCIAHTVVGLHFEKPKTLEAQDCLTMCCFTLHRLQWGVIYNTDNINMNKDIASSFIFVL